MSYQTIEIDGEEVSGVDEEEVSVRVVNRAREEGWGGDIGPLSWMNSARITVDPEQDAVHCVVSVGDPRGGFCMTIRRKPDGGLIIHLPHPGEGMAHEVTTESHPGTLIVGHDTPDGFKAGDYSDEEIEEEG